MALPSPRQAHLESRHVPLEFGGGYRTHPDHGAGSMLTSGRRHRPFLLEEVAHEESSLKVRLRSSHFEPHSSHTGRTRRLLSAFPNLSAMLRRFVTVLWRPSPRWPRARAAGRRGHATTGPSVMR